MFNNRYSIFLFFSIILLLGACKKDVNSPLGLNMQPEDETMTPKMDTGVALTVKAYTVRDNVKVALSNQAYYQLGSIYDPVFGVTTCNLITQMFPFSDVAPIPAGSTIDSVIMYFNYTHYTLSDGTVRAQSNPTSTKSTNLDPVKLTVYELNEILSIDDSTLYTDRTPAYKATPLVPETEIAFKTFDTISTLFGSAPMLKIQLPNSVGERISGLTEDVFKNSDEFMKVFGGFYLKIMPEATSNKGSMVTLNMEGSNTQVIVYYKKPDTTVQSTCLLAMKQLVTNDVVSYNEIQHDYSVAETALQAQLNGDDSKGRQSIYIQSAVGTLGKIQLPLIKELRTQRIIINQAKLIFSADNTNLTDYNRTPSFTIAYDSLGVSKSLPDQQASGTIDGIGGNLYNGKYVFYITRYIQQMLYHDSENYELTISPIYGIYNSDNAKLFGTDALHGDSRIRLEIIYTEIP